ncbi:MAG TPA: arylesterase [Burkholderiales bacterium]|nr:arylesterase [Burkholderiales bacterium]
MLRILLFALTTAWSAATAAGTILVYGDSLSAAYGIGQKEGWVTLLEERLKQRKLDYSVANASVSGETTSGGSTRIEDALVRFKPDVVIVALGANDGLRGLPVSEMKANLERIVRAAQAHKAKVLVAGMRMPPNYGQKYNQEFQRAFADVAKALHTGYVPFLLDGMADQRELFLTDQIHPSAQAQPIILDTVWKGLEPLLKR